MPIASAPLAQTIQLWLVEMDDGVNMIDDCRLLLSSRELARASTYRFADVQRTFIVSHACARLILGKCLSVPPSELRIDERCGGKPEVTWPNEGAQFSQSHSAGLFALAVTCGCCVGVDVECVSRLRPWKEIARRFFTTRECDALLSLPKGEQLTSFYKIWTEKEAYLKGTGEGLSRSLRAFQAERWYEGNGVIVDEMRSGGDPWMLANFDAGKGYVGTIAYCCGTPKIVAVMRSKASEWVAELRESGRSWPATLDSD
jgi:4'-phosphopantetheinyl transferase